MEIEIDRKNFVQKKVWSEKNWDLQYFWSEKLEVPK